MTGTRSVVLCLTGAACGLTVVSCSDLSEPGRNGEPDRNAVVAAFVSEPVSAASQRLAIGSVGTVYVSLAAGTFPRAARARIRHRASGTQYVGATVEGGLDPVAVQAAVGDTLDLTLLDDADSVIAARFAVVPARRAPRIVRTVPPRDKKDVPLNVRITIVFSEPIDLRTITSSSVQLLHDTTIVPALLEFSDSNHVALVVLPEVSLERSTTYALMVSSAVRDGDGDALDAALRVEFETEAVPTGSVRITTTTTGTDLDADGYVVQIDSGPSTTLVTANGTVTLAGLPEGEHQVRLAGVAPNCTVASPNPLTVAVSRDSTKGVAFAMACAALETRIVLRTSTTGQDIDPDGYTIQLSKPDTVRVISIAANATDTIPGLTAGRYGVYLDGVVENCTVGGGPLTEVTVAPGGTAVVQFLVTCVSTTALRITATTSGVDLDTDGYTVVVQRLGADRRVSIPVNGSATTAELLFGDFLVSLSGVAANCDVSGSNPRVVPVANGGTTATAFSVVCAPATLIAYSGTPEYPGPTANRDIYVVRSNGTNRARLTTHSASDEEPDWSPAGTIAFVSDRDGNREIYVMNGDGSAQTRLTNHAAADYEPAWSPDGSKIAFVSERDGNPDIYIMNADGSNPVRLTDNGLPDVSPAWSPSGARIAFRSEQAAFGPGNGEIMVMNADGSGITRLTSDAADDTGPAWSPDGTKIAFSRFMFFFYCCEDFPDEGIAQSDIFVIDADGPGRETRVGGVQRPSSGFFHGVYEDDEKSPAWSPDGRKIAFGLTECRSDVGDCHDWSTVTVITIGAPGFVFVDLVPDYARTPPYAGTTPAYAFTPAWRR